jgi:hypothetical protein
MTTIHGCLGTPRRGPRRLVYVCVLVGALIALAQPAGAQLCPQAVRFEVDGPTSDVDFGWTGIAHDFAMPDSTLTMRSTCSGSQFPPCSACTLSGPVPNAAGYNHRCMGDSSIVCNDDADCGVNAPCTYFFGPPWPTSAGGVPVCLTTQVASTPGVSGTFDATTGLLAPAIPLRWRVYIGILTNMPCPQCVGDGAPNDGARGGSCDGGPRDGGLCDGNAISPVALFGTTSFDCPPEPGANISGVGLLPESPVRFSSAGDMLTLSTASPVCSLAPFLGLRCACDTCATVEAEPCRSDADCPAGRTCGGRRCALSGNPCTSSADCGPGDGCTSIGEPTMPNQCADLVCTPTANGEGVCLSGPDDNYCAPPEQFLGCLDGTDCPITGVCLSVTRPCFPDDGVVGGTISAPGVTSIPVANSGTATIGAVTCARPVAGAASAVAGFPGPIRLTLPGTLTLAQEIVSRVAAPSDPVTTGGVPTASDPVETTVTSPNGGPVAIVEQNVTGTPPPVGYAFVSQQVNITAPAGTAGTPIVITFRLDNSRLPGPPGTTCGVRKAGIILQKNGTAVSAPCSGGGASPDPCLVGITCVNGDASTSSDVTITVRTVTASIWRIAVPEEVVALVPVSGKKLQIKDAADPAKRKLTLQLADANLETPVSGGADDPTCAGAGGGGASLQVFGTQGSGKVLDVYLPCAGWQPIGAAVDGKGYKYKDAKTLNGPCKTVMLKNRKPGTMGFKKGELKAVCGSSANVLEYDLEAGEGSIGVRVRTGAGAGWCAELGGVVSRDDATQFATKDASPPGTCAPLP